MAISPQRLTIYLYSAHRAVIFAIVQLSCYSISLHSPRLAVEALQHPVDRHFTDLYLQKNAQVCENKKENLDSRSVMK